MPNKGKLGPRRNAVVTLLDQFRHHPATERVAVDLPPLVAEARRVVALGRLPEGAELQEADARLLRSQAEAWHVRGLDYASRKVDSWKITAVVGHDRRLLAVVAKDGAGDVATVMLSPFDEPEAEIMAAVGRKIVDDGGKIDGHEAAFAALRSDDGSIAFLDSLAPRLDLAKDVSIRCRGSVRLPRIMTSKGSFSLEGCRVADNFETVSIDRDLCLVEIEGLELPADLNVGRDLRLIMCGETVLPERFNAGRDLDIAKSRVRRFPNKFKVGRNIIANDTLVERVEASFRCHGDLVLRNSPVASIGWGLEVGGSLDVTGTGLKRVPHDARIGGDLKVDPQTDVPESVKIGGRIMNPTAFGYVALKARSTA